MDDPISILVAAAGEDATLILNAPPAAYSPDSDYNPGPDVPSSLKVVPVGKTVELPDGCSAGVTYSATSVPAALQAETSELTWRSRKYTVHSWRERHHNGAINGITLFLKR